MIIQGGRRAPKVQCHLLVAVRLCYIQFVQGWNFYLFTIICKACSFYFFCIGEETAQSEIGPNRPNQHFIVEESKCSNDPKSSRSPELPRHKLYHPEGERKTYYRRSPREHSRSPSHRDYRAGRCPSAGIEKLCNWNRV